MSLVLSSCASVTATNRGSADFQYQPQYNERHHFFLLGIFGNPKINVKEVCVDRPARQMQSIFTPTDVMIGTLTAGLWITRTARVWCVRDEEIL